MASNLVWKMDQFKHIGDSFGDGSIDGSRLSFAAEIDDGFVLSTDGMILGSTDCIGDSFDDGLIDGSRLGVVAGVDDGFELC